ncbi:helix-turn-helix transcriptional regulator [Roseisalinus antarcticus]|uniref:HTH-type transcriptional regulator ChbR n=1 Tax=Roseisalinus antarcticus TaxID=254357 RepID=A0A1Y5SAH2_9RHOB|nr:AraC family transcriptional regulator [Roseisalinus antarcticus]SLN35941.1 HTH-type transcriptional regulator ChbR [Roseisalinus antarcticus]
MLQTDLSASDFLPAGEAFQLVRATIDSRRPKGLIRRDFPILFWVQNGAVRLHTAEGRTELKEGDVVFLRARDSHALQARAEESMAVLLVFDPTLIDRLSDRHAALSERFFWSSDPTPVRVHRDIRQLSALNQGALRLERSRRDALEVEAFLLPLLASLLDGSGMLPPEAPDWLARACAAAEDPRIFREGAAGFARIAGRAHPHVSRTTRRFLGKSPSEIINAQRMAYAAKRLTGTSDTLAEIAADCGIPNLSHFHKLFRAHHGITPQRYRKAHQKDLIQPG